jgi:hypothetical protein
MMPPSDDAADDEEDDAEEALAAAPPQAAFRVDYCGHLSWDTFYKLIDDINEFNLLVSWHRGQAVLVDCAPLCGCSEACNHHAPHFVVVHPRTKVLRYGWVPCTAEQEGVARLALARSAAVLARAAQYDGRAACTSARLAQAGGTA